MRELLSVVFNMSISLNHDATLRKAFLILESVLTVNTYIQIHKNKPLRNILLPLHTCLPGTLMYETTNG